MITIDSGFAYASIIVAVTTFVAAATTAMGILIAMAFRAARSGGVGRRH